MRFNKLFQRCNPPPLSPLPTPPSPAHPRSSSSRFTRHEDHNVDVLDRAGVLGAVLALIAREANSVRAKRPLSKASADCLQVRFSGDVTLFSPCSTVSSTRLYRTSAEEKQMLGSLTSRLRSLLPPRQKAGRTPSTTPSAFGSLSRTMLLMVSRKRIPWSA